MCVQEREREIWNNTEDQNKIKKGTRERERQNIKKMPLCLVFFLS